jgi:hypothetical protein
MMSKRKIVIPERRLVLALIACDGFITLAARRLRVHRLVVHRRLDEIGLLGAAAGMRYAAGWRGGPSTARVR